MDFRELFVKLWEISGPPADLSEDIRNQDADLLKEILNHGDSEGSGVCNCSVCQGKETDFFQLLLQMAGIQLRKELMEPEKGIKSSGVQMIEIDSLEKMQQIMSNVSEGRHPMDNGDGLEATPDDVNSTIDKLFKSAGGGNGTLH